MIENYDAIKFYSNKDMSIGHNLEKAEPIIEAFDSSKEYSDINEVIELFNIQELMSSGVALEKWDSQTITRLSNTCKRFSEIIGRFFSKIMDSNIKTSFQSLNRLYVEDFWLLFSKYKVFSRVSGKTVVELLDEDVAALWPILEHKNIVLSYDHELAEFMRTSEQTAELLLGSLLSERDCQYFFPKSLLPTEYESIFEVYIDSESPNPNYLNLLAISRSTEECPISPKLRLKAKRRYYEVVKRMSLQSQGFEYGVNVAFDDNEPFVSSGPISEGISQYTYSARWIKENLDYPTLLNNFRYLFDQVDACWRSNLPSVESQIGVIEKNLGIKGKNEYKTGVFFRQQDMKTLFQIRGYREILTGNGIDIEDLFRWFFEDYLPKEFHTEGFAYSPSSNGTTFLEKCRNIACEIDGVLKQFSAFLQNGEIDRELYESSSESVPFSCIGSWSKKKYAYADSQDLRTEMFLLFSDQAPVNFTEKTQSKYRSFASLIVSESMKRNDFFQHQLPTIDWLIARGSIAEDKDGLFQISLPRVLILKDLFDHDVICPNYYRSASEMIDSMVQQKDLRYESTLFSEPEQAYLNYELNHSQFSNGRDLRNKYAHSSYSKDLRVQEEDYDRLLRIMALVVIKINEEFCLKYPLDRHMSAE